MKDLKGVVGCCNQEDYMIKKDDTDSPLLVFALIAVDTSFGGEKREERLVFRDQYK